MHPLHRLSQVTAAEQVAASHKVLMANLAQILDMDNGPIAARLLDHLKVSMPYHFRMEEERDGIFDWIVMLTPSQGPEIDALLDDHQALLAEVLVLRPPVRLDGRHDEAATLQLRAFAEHLRKHERRESLALKLALEAAKAD
ncbi:MAG: hypothetical protein GXP62_07785 [Oligoflexia bacterium]|nr:hypothetical protein [Oligoflexia bacterium]